LTEEDSVARQALEILQAEPYVREAAYVQGKLRLYVHQGEMVLPGMLRLLDHARIGLKSVSLSQPTLDDVFLRKTGRSLQEAVQ